VNVTSNGLPYAIEPLSCPVGLSITLLYCGQTIEWIKMPLGTEVGFDPDDIVLDGDSAPPTERGTAALTFRPMSVLAKRSPISATVELLFPNIQTHKLLCLTTKVIDSNQVWSDCVFVDMHARQWLFGLTSLLGRLGRVTLESSARRRGHYWLRSVHMPDGSMPLMSLRPLEWSVPLLQITDMCMRVKYGNIFLQIQCMHDVVSGFWGGDLLTQNHLFVPP